MQCPYCRNKELKVTDKRQSNEGKNIRRRRECLKCSKRFTTYERIETIDLQVLKKDNTKEQFDLDKLISGLERACNKTPVTELQITRVADKIESELRRLKAKEIKSTQIGEKVLRELKKLDHVAYLRFASVYQNFQDVKDFEKEIKQIK